MGFSELLSLARLMLSWTVKDESAEVFASSIACCAESAAAMEGTVTSAFVRVFWAEALRLVVSNNAEMQICDILNFTFSYLC